jgi:nicotinamidase-related amidase
MVTETYSTDSTALLLVDLLNDFLYENGKLAERIGGMLKKTNLKEHLKRLIDGARAGRHAHEEGLHVTFLKTQSLSSLRRRTTRRSSFRIPPSVTK